MNYETSEPETKEHHKACENKTGIVIAGDHPSISRGLIQLISKEAKLVDCVEVDNANQALDAIKEREADFAIVDISSQDTSGIWLAKKIKLQFPNIPVLILSMDNGGACAERSQQSEAEGHPLNEQVTERIIKAVLYVQSLLRSRISGFTILVKTERSE
jgi:DNA-binding NarL/FixJ family response regulator